jgi:flagellar biosynthesis protein FliR
VELPLATITTLMLAAVRATAWLLLAPPFSSRAVPARAKALLAVALALPVVPRLQGTAPDIDTAPFVGAIAAQVLAGAALGFLCSMVFAAVQAAGDLIDLFGGFSLAFAFDPLSQTGTSIFGRFYGLTALTLLFASNGHLVLLHGFLRTYDVLPLDAALSLATLGGVLTEGLGQLLLAALQIAGPLMAVLFLADIGLGLLTRVAPQLNAFALGFPLKILLTLLMVGAGFALLPAVVEALAERAVTLMGGVAAG